MIIYLDYIVVFNIPIIHYFKNMNLCSQCLRIQAASIASAFVRCAKHTRQRQQQKATGYVHFAANPAHTHTQEDLAGSESLVRNHFLERPNLLYLLSLSALSHTLH